MDKIEFESLFTLDADDVSKTITKLTPSCQDDFLEKSLAEVLSAEPEPQRLSTAILVAQSILSDGGGSFVPNECLVRLEKIIKLTKDTDDKRIKRQAALLANLLAQRLGKALAKLPPESLGILDQLEAIDSVSSIAKRLKLIIGNSHSHPRTSGRQFDLPNLNVDRAKENVILDSKQDWYSDPWEWPELSNLDNQDVANRLKSDACGWTFALDVPKSADGTRPAIVVNPIDRVAYQSLADELSLVATKDLPEWVFGWRVKRQHGAKGAYENNATEWKQYKKRIRENAGNYPFVIRLDVRSFFESVDTENLLSNIGRNYKKTATLNRLASYFAELSSRRNGQGLPQRSLASSILAHLPLASVDNYLSIAKKEVGNDRVEPVRWMDDFWIFGNSEERLRKVSVEVEAALSHRSLGLNPDKTVFDECNSAIENLLLDTSGIGSDNAGDEKLMKAFKGGAAVTRSDINYWLKYQGEGADHVSGKLLEVLTTVSLKDFTQAAVGVAEFIKKNHAWPNHSEWYQDLVRSQEDQHSWSIAAWGRMFPNEIGESAEASVLKDFFSERFVSQIQQSLLPLAANRLASWKPEAAKELFKDFLAQSYSSDRFFSVRAIALALRQSGWAKADILAELKKNNEDDEAALSKIL